MQSEWRGGRFKFPFFFRKRDMIDSKLVENIVNEYLEGREIFLVGVKVSKNNIITVTIDSDSKVVVENCIEVSKYIEKNLNRDEEDFELTVTSFGLGEYFVMERQYKKNIGQNIEVVLDDGSKENGILTEVSDGTILITQKKKIEPVIIELITVKKSRVVISL